MSYKSDPRGSRPVSLVAVHTAEGARTAAALGAYFYQPGTQASSHVGIDAGATLQYVGYDRSAWTIRSGNPISDNAELCAFAHFTRDQWMSTAAVEGCANPRAILDRTAEWIRSRCLARGIPIRRLTLGQVASGMSGVIGHIDWTFAMGDGTHTDPGAAGFPWDYVMNKAASGSAPAPPPLPPPGLSGVEIMERKTIPASPSTTSVRLLLSGSQGAAIVIRPKIGANGIAADPVFLGNIFAWGNDKTGVGGNPKNIPGYNFRITSHRRLELPGAVWADVEYSSNVEFEVDIVG